MRTTKYQLTAFLLPAVLWLGLAVRVGAADKAAVQAPVAEFTVKALLKDPDAYWDKTIVVEGLVAQVCPRSGTKAWLHDLDPQAEGLVRVERVGKLPSFGRELEGKTLRVTGVLRELRIDKAYLDSWEARIKGQKKASAGEDPCTEKCEESQSVVEGLKRVQAVRDELAKSNKDHLSALWVDGMKWEVKKKRK